MLYISADNHLMRFVWKRRKEVEGDALRAFTTMVDAIVGDPVKEPKRLLLAGDITDKAELDAATFHCLDDAAEKLADAEIPVFYIMGNHDIDVPDWPGELGFVSLNNKTARIDDRRVHGLGYLSREMLHPALGRLLPCEILVLHQTFEHLLPFEDSFDMRMDDLPGGIANVVVGDVHTPNLTSLNGKGWCLSPGSTTPRRISETHTPGYWRLAKDAEKPEFFELPHRRILRTEVRTLEELQGLVAACSVTVKGAMQPLLELAYPLELSAAVEEFMAAQQGLAVFFPRPGTTGKMLADESVRPVFDKLTLEGALPMLGLEKKDPPVHTFLHDLLTNANVNDYLDQKIELAKKGE